MPVNDSTRSWRRFLRPQDLVWFLFYAALAVISPGQSDAELEMLAALALLQVLAGRVEWLSTPRGNLLVVLLQLVIGFLLIGVTGGLLSSYYLILIVPVVSAATTLGLWGAALTSILACGAYAAFLPVARSLGYDISADILRETSLRVIFLIAVGYLTYQLAESNRAEARRAQATAGELADAIRNLQKAEDTVRRTERLAALGQLTAGLAHELRNPMGTMKASAELLLQKIDPQNELAREMAEYISSEVDRANSLISRFLDFARPLQLRWETVNVNDLLDQVIERFARTHPSIVLHRNYAPDIGTIPGDPQLLERVFTNLIQNAIDASPPDGPVTVKTRRLEDAIEIAILDRGSGIRAESREQIFNPFFTTKATGVGLGLAIVSKIIDEHHGRITVDSAPGKGSIFQVLLRASPYPTVSSSL